MCYNLSRGCNNVNLGYTFVMNNDKKLCHQLNFTLCRLSEQCGVNGYEFIGPLRG